MTWVKSKDRDPLKNGYYTVKGLNNQGNAVVNEYVWFSGDFWLIREGCKVIEWFDENIIREERKIKLERLNKISYE